MNYLQILKDEECESLRWFYGDGENFKFMRRKGIYPYRIYGQLGKIR